MGISGEFQPTLTLASPPTPKQKKEKEKKNTLPTLSRHFDDKEKHKIKHNIIMKIIMK